MSVTVPGVPPYVSRTQVLHALTSLGLNPDVLAGIAFDHDGITVEVFAGGRPDVPGHRWTHDGKRTATHRLTIPIVDKDSE